MKWFPIMIVNPFFSATKFDTIFGTWVGWKGKKITIVKDAGWHFTKIYSIEDTYEHAQNTPHSEFLKDGVSIKEMASRIEMNLTAYGKITKGKLVAFDDTFPIYVLQNRIKFEKYIAPMGLI
jgi:hypothetical protein